MIALGIVVLVLVLLVLLPIGVIVRYDKSGAWVQMQIGPIYKTIYPSAAVPVTREHEKKKRPKKEKEPKEKKDKTGQLLAQLQGGSVSDFWPMVKVGATFLNALRRRLLVRNLVVQVSFGGEDPAQKAINYGRAYAIIGTLMPFLQSWFRIKKQQVGATCRFDQTDFSVYAELHVTLLILDVLALLVHYGIKLFGTYTRLQKQKKQRSVPQPSADAQQFK